MHQTQLLLIASCLHVLLVLDVSTEGAIIPHTRTAASSVTIYVERLAESFSLVHCWEE